MFKLYIKYSLHAIHFLIIFNTSKGFPKQEELLDLSHLATDGGKVKANTSSIRVMTKEELEVSCLFLPHLQHRQGG